DVMEEYNTTSDGEMIQVQRQFLVIATQNPVESNYGTFPLPEAQLDRFLFKIDIGYPEMEEEKRILHTYRTSDPMETIKPILTLDDIRSLQWEIKVVMLYEISSDEL